MCQNNLKQLKYNVYNSRPPEAIMVVKNKVLSHGDRGQLETPPVRGGLEPGMRTPELLDVTCAVLGSGTQESGWHPPSGLAAVAGKQPHAEQPAPLAASLGASLPPLTPAANTHLAS